MKKNSFKHILTGHRNQIVSGIVMITAGLMTGAAAERRTVFFPQPPSAPAAARLSAPPQATPAAALFYAAMAAAAPAEATPAEAAPMEATPTEAAMVLLPDRLNLAFIRADGEEGGPGAGSMAQLLYEVLAAREAGWTSEIYGLYNQSPISLGTKLGIGPEALLGAYNPLDPAQNSQDPATWVVPDFKSIHVTFLDGDGRRAAGQSNLKDIIAMASVYNYYGNAGTLEELKEYALGLWEVSHSYSCQISPVYYCGGCIKEEDAGAEESGAADETAAETSVNSGETAETPAESGAVPESEAETRAPRETERVIVEGVDGGPGVTAPVQEETGETPQEDSPRICPGHVDLEIQVTMAGLDGSSSLFRRDSRSADSPGNGDSGWPGWNDETMGYVRTLCSQDWFEEYGLTVENLVVRNPLTASDIDQYIKMLPLNASKTRTDLVRFALTSVGRVPYYWGGKPGAPGYEVNRFGIVTSPDEDGRFLKGLDCSGWISWVYWSVTGNRLDGESTNNQIYCGKAVSKEELQPGDICIRLGSKAHAVMFLGWTDEGQMRCIQETSGNINNVEVGICAADWTYYRRLVD